MDRVRVKQIPVESFLFLVVTTTQQQVAQHRAYGVTSTIFLEGACGVLDGANVTVHARHDVGGRHEHCVGLRLVLVLVLVLGVKVGLGLGLGLVLVRGLGLGLVPVFRFTARVSFGYTVPLPHLG